MTFRAILNSSNVREIGYSRELQQQAGGHSHRCRHVFGGCARRHRAEQDELKSTRQNVGRKRRPISTWLKRKRVDEDGAAGDLQAHHWDAQTSNEFGASSVDDLWEVLDQRQARLLSCQGKRPSERQAGAKKGGSWQPTAW